MSSNASMHVARVLWENVKAHPDVKTYKDCQHNLDQANFETAANHTSSMKNIIKVKDI